MKTLEHVAVVLLVLAAALWLARWSGKRALRYRWERDYRRRTPVARPAAEQVPDPVEHTGVPQPMKPEEERRAERASHVAEPATLRGTFPPAPSKSWCRHCHAPFAPHDGTWTSTGTGWEHVCPIRAGQMTSALVFFLALLGGISIALGGCYALVGGVLVIATTLCKDLF